MKARKISQITTFSLCNWSLKQALENVGLYSVLMTSKYMYDLFWLF